MISNNNGARSTPTAADGHYAAGLRHYDNRCRRRRCEQSGQRPPHVAVPVAAHSLRLAYDVVHSDIRATAAAAAALLAPAPHLALLFTRFLSI